MLSAEMPISLWTNRDDDRRKKNIITRPLNDDFDPLLRYLKAGIVVASFHVNFFSNSRIYEKIVAACPNKNKNPLETEFVSLNRHLEHTSRWPDKVEGVLKK